MPGGTHSSATPPPDPRIPEVLRDPARLAALRNTGLLDTPGEEAFDRLTRIAARLLAAPMALVNLLGEERQFSKSCFVPEHWSWTRDVSLADSFCRHTVVTREPLVIPDTHEDPRVSSSVFVTELGVRAYLGIPLIPPGGHVLGALCVMDFAPRAWPEEDVRILRDLTEQVVTEISLRHEMRQREQTERALRAGEERLALLDRALAAASEGILISDASAADQPIIYASGGFERLTGYSAAQVLGRNPRFLRGPDTAPEATAEVREAIREGRPCVAEILNYREDGTTFWNRMSVSPVRDAVGAVTHFIGVQQDVTHQKEAEEALREAKEEAERANRAKSEFLSRMSHELRTPLNAILGFGQLMEADVTSPDDRESVEQILQAGRHLLGLINEVLDVARIEAGRLTVSLEPVAVHEVAGQTVDLVRPLAAQRGIRVETDRAHPCHAYVRADLQRLKQVLLNFLSNAIKYNRSGGSVVLSCHPVEEDRVRISVRDTGPGIAPEIMERLFTPFERLGAERTGVEGAGLGLALSRGLAQLMEGSLGAESLPGEGSTFWIELPLVASPPHLQEEPADEEPTAPRPTHTVLYVEDNLSNFRLVERILAQSRDVRLLPAIQGRLALELAREHRPDLILLDLNLPDMHGEEVLRQIQDDPGLRDVPVVVISADATPAQRRRLLSLGAVTYLTKPLDVKEFLRVVDVSLPARDE